MRVDGSANPTMPKDPAQYSVAIFRRRFRLSDGVAYAFLENSRLYRTDRRLSVADGTQGSDCSECGRDMSRTCP